MHYKCVFIIQKYNKKININIISNVTCSKNPFCIVTMYIFNLNKAITLDVQLIFKWDKFKPAIS